jgi:hypothetical protein
MLYAIIQRIGNLKPVAFTENADVLGMGPEGPVIAKGKERTVLPMGSFTHIHVRAINQNRWVVGQGKLREDGEWHALLWLPDCLIDLGPGIAFGIDETGAVGGKTWEAGIGYATRWNADGMIWRESSESEVFGVGRNGTLFGASRGLPCFWTSNGERTDLPLPEGNWATGFTNHGNSKGQVLGSVSLLSRDLENIGTVPKDEEYDADILWTEGKPSILHRHSDSMEWPCGISEEGQVLINGFVEEGPLLVGLDRTVRNLYHMVRGADSDDPISLPVFQGRSISVSRCQAVAIDAGDQILAHYKGNAIIFAPTHEVKRSYQGREGQFQRPMWVFLRPRA